MTDINYKTKTSRSFFYSELYKKVFYTRHEIDFYNNQQAYEEVKYNGELLAAYYMIDLGFGYRDEDEKWELVAQMLLEDLSYRSVYFEPLIFNEAMALKCGLIPFAYKGTNMLALLGYDMDLLSNLATYQTLAHNTIDQHSSIFCSANECDKYFEEKR